MRGTIRQVTNTQTATTPMRTAAATTMAAATLPEAAPRTTIASASRRPDLELTLPARAENIAVVRHAVGALCEACAVDEAIVYDVRTAVTEACTNVVEHAYPDGQEGPLEVFALLLDGELTVAVRDRGQGIVPRSDSPGLGLGLPLIVSLAKAVQLGNSDDGHTEVRMTFSLNHFPIAPGG